MLRYHWYSRSIKRAPEPKGKRGCLFFERRELFSFDEILGGGRPEKQSRFSRNAFGSLRLD